MRHLAVSHRFVSLKARLSGFFYSNVWQIPQTCSVCVYGDQQFIATADFSSSRLCCNKCTASLHDQVCILQTYIVINNLYCEVKKHRCDGQHDNFGDLVKCMFCKVLSGQGKTFRNVGCVKRMCSYRLEWTFGESRLFCFNFRFA